VYLVYEFTINIIQILLTYLKTANNSRVVTKQCTTKSVTVHS